MRTSGDVVDLELGAPTGRETGLRHPAVLVTAQRIPDADNGLDAPSAAQCQHLRAVSPGRVSEVRGNVGTVALAQIRDVIAVILDTMAELASAPGLRCTVDLIR